MASYNFTGSDDSDPYDLADPLNWDPNALPGAGDDVSIDTVENTIGTALYGSLTANDISFENPYIYVDDADITANDLFGDATVFLQSSITTDTLESVSLTTNTTATVTGSVGVNLFDGWEQTTVYVNSGSILNANSSPQELAVFTYATGGTLNLGVGSFISVEDGGTAIASEITDDLTQIGSNITLTGEVPVNYVGGGTLNTTNIVNAGTLYDVNSNPLYLISVGLLQNPWTGEVYFTPTSSSTVTASNVYSASGAQYGLYIDVAGTGAQLNANYYDENPSTPAGLTNELMINDGGNVTINNAIGIGRQQGDTSNVLISGAGSSLTYNGSATFIVGDAGLGVLSVDDGATETLPNLIAGNQQGSQGQVLVNGDGSSLTITGNAILGNAGNSSLSPNNPLSISDQSNFTVQGNLTLGAMETGLGSLVVDNAFATAAYGVVIGEVGAGNLTIQDGGEFAPSISSPPIYLAYVLGQQQGSSGSILVTGSGSQLLTSNFQSITVGLNGVGNLTVQNSGEVSAVNGSIYVGENQGSSGAVNMSGGATLNASNMYLGGQGQGTLFLTQGSGITLGTGLSDGGGNLTVAGSPGSSWFELQSGSTVTVYGSVNLGAANTSDVYGTGTQLAYGADLVIGATDNDAVLQVSGGGNVSFIPYPFPSPEPNSLVDLSIGTSGTFGEVKVSDTGSFLGALSAQIGMAGLLNVSDSGTVELAGSLAISGSTITENSGGAIDIGQPLAQPQPGINVSAGGGISGFGQISATDGVDVAEDASITANGGTLGIAGDVTGQGTLQISASASLSISGSEQAPVIYTGFGGSLILQSPAAFAGLITGFQTGETIELQGITLEQPTLNPPFVSGSSTMSGHMVWYNPILAVTDTSSDIYTFNLEGQYTDPAVAITVTDGNSYITLSGGTYGPPCFYSGTLIQTRYGEVAVEGLSTGDTVTIVSGETRPIKWIGRRKLASRFSDPLRAWPIRIKANALGEGIPSRDLLLSPDHAVLIDGLLIQAGALVNGTSIVREANVPEIFTYYHVELDDHSLILAENTPAETFVDNVDRMGFDNWSEFEALYPEGKAIIEMPYPRAKAYRQVPRAIRERLADRGAAIYGPLANAA